MTATGSALFEPPDWLEREEEMLAPYAMRTRQSRGRRHPEEAHPYRTLYQRDRDRIVGATLEETPHVFVAALWERPDGAKEWKVPRLEVEYPLMARPSGRCRPGCDHPS